MSNRQRRISFGKWLKSRREAVHLTQMDLARHLNYENPQIISNIERGFSALPSRRVYDFAQALHCNGLELELRRVLSSAKDEECAAALETMLLYLPTIESLSRESITTAEIMQTVSQFRQLRGLPSISDETDSSSHVMLPTKATAEY